MTTPDMRTYYERRAREYDTWYEGTGKFVERDRPGWEAEVRALSAALSRLPPVATLDVACGTAFLTRRLPGTVTGLDQSQAMLEVARERMPDATFVRGDALALPFADGAFERVFTGHFYGHLQPGEREAFVSEARRVGGELVVADSALRKEVSPEEWQARVLEDGSRHRVYKRFFTAEGLAAELGGGETLHAGRWFVVVRSPGR
jgi:ubiquinone/menaquinone biosynthesis C-methylase UbiE